MVKSTMFLTIRKAADRFGIPEHFLREAIKNGTIPSLKVGNRFYLNAETLHQTLTNLFNSEDD